MMLVSSSPCPGYLPTGSMRLCACPYTTFFYRQKVLLTYKLRVDTMSQSERLKRVSLCFVAQMHCSARHEVIGFNAPLTYRWKNLFTAVAVGSNINISLSDEFTALLAEHTCFEVTVPSLKHTEPSYVDVQVQVQINGTIESGQNQDPVLVYPHRNTILIQTDRQMYKPGDRVKIRLLALSQDLLGDSRHKVNVIS